MRYDVLQKNLADMDLKEAAEDFVDPRPIKKVTAYALGTALQGVGMGLFLPLMIDDLSLQIRIGIGIACILVGAVLAVTAYSALKRRFRIVEVPQSPNQNTT
ncbi:hypothetical protein [Haloferula sp.]|uniref:hypothetical protein n=1 Tax=Haloferula sp. TaxID=2497595 RepID=UPI00329AC699